jgi:hypothetical protein
MNNWTPDRFLKAIIGSLISGLTAIQASILSSGGMDLTAWIVALIAMLTAFTFVYSVPNKLSPSDLSLQQAAPLPKTPTNEGDQQPTG